VRAYTLACVCVWLATFVAVLYFAHTHVLTSVIAANLVVVAMNILVVIRNLTVHL
jgi:hypothetical protein